MLRRPRGSVTARHCLVSRIFTFAGALQVLRLTTPLVDHLTKKYIQPLIKTVRQYNQRGAFLPSSSQLLCAPALSLVLQLPSFSARAEGTKRDFFCFAHFIFPSQSSITAMDEEDGQDYPEFLLPLWSHETLLVLLPCSLSLQPRPNLTTRIMRLAATISRNLYFSNLGLLGIHLLLFFRVRHVCLRVITMITLITCNEVEFYF